MSVRCLSLFALLLIVPAVLRAHDPYEITADFRADAKYVELRVTFSRLTALKVAGRETGGRKQFGPQQFEEVRPALEACARRVLEVRAGTTALAIVELAAALTPESDIEFRVVYARPSAGPLAVRFEAAFLRDLDDPGYAAVVQAIHRRRVVQDARLHRDAPAVELALPAAE